MKNYPLKPGVLCYFGLPPKILLIMKMVIIILITCLMQVSAASFAQKLTLSKKGATLEQIFAEIRKQTGYFVVYAENKVDKTTRMDVNFNNTDLKDVLDVVSKSQDLVYTFDEKNISLKPKEKEEPTFLERLANRWAAIDISGTVVDDKGYPLPGATVKAKGAKAVITDIKGRFMLEKVEEGTMVTISYTGYVTQELPAKQSMGTIALKLSDNPLDQVQIIAYGTQTKRYSLGNVVSVKAVDIEKQPVQNPLLALQGRVAGLEITQANGMNGGGVKVRIQGTNSIRNGSDPLIIIDGMPYASQTLATTNVGTYLLGYSGDISGALPSQESMGGNGSPLNYINPADIESIEVLKDADATAIYGSRAANGAILITTKKGKAGETQLNFNLQQGWGHVRKFIDLLNTQQYLEMRREAFKNDGTTPGATDYDLNGHWDTNRETDWQKELIGGTARYQDAVLTLSGGSNTTNFYLSGTYNRRGTVFPGGSDGNPSGNLHFSISNTSANQKFIVQFTGSFMSNVNRLPGSDPTLSAITRAPNAPALYNADGSLNWAPTADGTMSIRNPLTSTLSRFKMKTTNMFSSLALGYKILPDLEIKTTIGYTYQQLSQFLGTPLTSAPPEDQSTAVRSAEYSFSERNSWNVEPQLTYRRALGIHHVDILVGGTVQQNFGNGFNMEGTGYNSDASLESAKAAGSIKVGGTVIPTYKYVGAFARLNYRLKERYLINLSARRDGSSRFGPGSRFHNFASIAGGWIFTEEPLLKKNLPFLSFGKLRASFGTTGNDQIGDYRYMSLVDLSPASAYQGTKGYYISQIANAYLEWEEKKSLQMGLDLGFVKERILITASYFRSRNYKPLLPYELPTISGARSVESNFPATMQNKGIELELKTVNIKSPSLQWSTSINFSMVRNKLVEFENLENSTYAGFFIIGKPYNIKQVYQFMGINPTTGLYQFTGKNGLTSDAAEALSKAAIVDPNTRFYGGFQNNLTYKRISLDFLLSFAKKTALGYVNPFYSASPGNFYGGYANHPVAVLNRWQQSGDNREYQKFSQDPSSSISYLLWDSSDQRYVDASFISLKNVSLSYQLPVQWVQKIALKSARIYTQAQNVWTFTKYKGFDPESPGNGLPPLRTITLGIQASL